MSIFVCELQGVRGRSMKLYDNKCVITTDVTLGSILTSNALDGEKTVFFADVVGVQYKRSGATIGYLQLETPSSQMNNNSSNMFSENTFTFEHGTAGITNSLMDLIHGFIVDRLEAYKYGGETDIMKNIPAELLVGLSAANIKIDTKLQSIGQQYIDEKEREEEERKMKVAEERRQEIQEMMKELPETEPLANFAKIAGQKNSFAEIYSIWINMDIKETTVSLQIADELKRYVALERSYGSTEKDYQQFLNKINEMILMQSKGDNFIAVAESKGSAAQIAEEFEKQFLSNAFLYENTSSLGRASASEDGRVRFSKENIERMQKLLSQYKFMESFSGNQKEGALRMVKSFYEHGGHFYEPIANGRKISCPLCGKVQPRDNTMCEDCHALFLT